MLEIVREVRAALDADADAEVFLALLEKHQGVMAELKQTETISDPDVVSLIRQAGKDIVELMQQINCKRDELGGQIMQSKSKKRAFDAYHKV